jgi:glucokinase
MQDSGETLLAGDVGGTKTILTIASPEKGARHPVARRAFRSARHTGLEPMVAELIRESKHRPRRAVFGVAGPVVDGRAKLSNLPWVLDESELADRLGLESVRLLNDLEAIAWAIPHLEGDDLVEVSAALRGDPGGDPCGNIAVVAPGTGLGEAFLTMEGACHRPHGCEGGHTDFAPTDETQLELARHLSSRFGHVSYERVACGSGLPNIYGFFKETGVHEEPSWLREELERAEDPTPVIFQAGLGKDPSCDIARATVKLFLQVLGAETGNFALKIMATGGIYLAGGIPPRIVDFLKGPEFLGSMRAKGRMSSLVERMPVYVVKNPETALLGATHCGLGFEQ